LLGRNLRTAGSGEISPVLSRRNHGTGIIRP